MIRTSTRTIATVVEHGGEALIEATKIISTTLKVTRKSYLPLYEHYGEQLLKDVKAEQPLLDAERKLDHENRILKLLAKRTKLQAKATSTGVSLDLSSVLS